MTIMDEPPNDRPREPGLDIDFTHELPRPA